MKKMYFGLLSFLMLSGPLSGMDTVRVDPGFGTLQTAIAEIAQNGNEAVSNTAFVLERGEEYEIDQRIENVDYALTIVAEEGDGPRPVVLQGVDGDGNYHRSFQPGNNLTLKGLFVSGATKTGESKNHIIRGGMLDGRIYIEDCHLDRNFASLMRIDADNMSVYIINSIVSHLSNPDKPGAANLIQDKSTMLDSLVIRNTTIYNVRNRLFFEDGGPNNYIEVDHCTFVNVGKSALELNQTIKAKVTNNHFINVGYWGAYPVSDSLFAVKVDTLKGLVAEETQEIEISNNNFFVDPDLVDALPDTVDASYVMNVTASGYASESAFLNEEIAFTAPPPSVLPLLGIWQDPESTYEYENVDQNPSYDFGYDDSHASYTGASDGGAIGDLKWMAPPSSVFNPETKNNALNCYPNPVTGDALLSFEAGHAGIASIDMFSITGSLVKRVYHGSITRGINKVDLNAGDLNSGLYLTRLNVNGKVSTLKILVE